MTARLPIIHGDLENWDTILNEYLQVSHNNDGTQKAHKSLHVVGGADAFVGGDLLNATAKVDVLDTGSLIGTRRGINLIEGANVKITMADDSGNERVNVTIDAPSLLAYKQYSPGSATTLASAINNNTFQVIDSTNLSITFTAPANGNVLVRLSARAGRNDNTTNRVWWGLLDGGGTYVTGSGAKIIDSTGLVIAESCAFMITGLTPGNSYTWRWAHRPDVSGATSKATLLVGGDPNDTVNNNAHGPAVMEIWATP